MGETMRRLRNGFVIGLGFLGAVLLIPLVGAAALSTLNTGNGVFPADFADINFHITQLNNEIANSVTFGNAGETGQMAITNAAGIAANGSVATAMSSVGPTGSHTTPQEWLVVINPAGTLRWAPLF